MLGLLGRFVESVGTSSVLLQPPEWCSDQRPYSTLACNRLHSSVMGTVQCTVATQCIVPLQALYQTYIPNNGSPRDPTNMPSGKGLETASSSSTLLSTVGSVGHSTISWQCSAVVVAVSFRLLSSQHASTYQTVRFSEFRCVQFPA